FGRYNSDGPNNGEAFRNNKLVPALTDAEVHQVVVYLDSVKPGYEYSSSFLEEAFGGLIRVNKIPYDLVVKKLKIVTKYEDYVVEINNYLKRAAS
ncbi:MAG: STAS-like domain-containing protein, partial [Pseudomonas sp.]|nr:STAS-like domain-containing protein [Pseudomonas sp.]